MVIFCILGYNKYRTSTAGKDKIITASPETLKLTVQNLESEKT